MLFGLRHTQSFELMSAFWLGTTVCTACCLRGALQMAPELLDPLDYAALGMARKGPKWTPNAAAH